MDGYAPSSSHFYPAPGRQHSRHHSFSSSQDPMHRTGYPDSTSEGARPSSMSTNSSNSRSRRASSPLASSPYTQPPILHITPSSEASSPNVHASSPFGGGRADQFKVDTDAPRDSAPVLLAGAFRDSAFSSSTGWRSTEIPITWTGKDPEPISNGDAQPQPPLSSSPPRVMPLGPRERKPSGGTRTEPQSTQPSCMPPLERHGSSGPILPGGWMSTPREDKRHDDVAGNGTAYPTTASTSTSPHSSSMIPPTIAEQPSQEDDEVFKRTGSVRVHSPEQHRVNGEGARKSEAAWVGNTQERQATFPQAGFVSRAPPAANGVANGTVHQQSSHIQASQNGQPPPIKRRANSISEGWVLVHLDGKARSGPPSQPRAAPPIKHQRSQSDSRVPTTGSLAQSAATAGAGRSTMSPAAKAIVAVDAAGAKEAQREKAQSKSKLRRLLGRSTDKGGDSRGDRSAQSTPEPGQAPSAAKGKQVQGSSTGRSPPQGSRR